MATEAGAPPRRILGKKLVKLSGTEHPCPFARQRAMLPPLKGGHGANATGCARLPYLFYVYDYCEHVRVSRGSEAERLRHRLAWLTPGRLELDDASVALDCKHQFLVRFDVAHHRFFHNISRRGSMCSSARAPQYLHVNWMCRWSGD